MISVLRGESKVYDLDRLRDSEVGLLVGRAAFKLLAFHGDLPGIVVMDDIKRNNESLSGLLRYSAEYQDQTRYGWPVIEPFYPGVILHERESLTLGRENGIEVHVLPPREYTTEDQLTWTPLNEALRLDKTLDAKHAEITAVGNQKVRIEDFDTEDGTRVFIY